MVIAKKLGLAVLLIISISCSNETGNDKESGLSYDSIDGSWVVEKASAVEWTFGLAETVKVDVDSDMIGFKIGFVAPNKQAYIDGKYVDLKIEGMTLTIDKKNVFNVTEISESSITMENDKPKTSDQYEKKEDGKLRYYQKFWTLKRTGN